MPFLPFSFGRMAYNYDNDYNTPDYFGKPIPDVLNFYQNHPVRGNLLDIGAGQGRDALPLAGMGYRVTAIDTSETGINSLRKVASERGLSIETRVHDLDRFEHCDTFDFIHANSVFYFRPEENQVSDELRLQRIYEQSRTNAIFLVGFANAENRAEKLGDALAKLPRAEILFRKYIDTSTTEKVSGLKIASEYHFTVFRKG